MRSLISLFLFLSSLINATYYTSEGELLAKFNKMLKMQNLFKIYNVKTISPSEIPSGVIPVEMTIEEFEEFLKRVNSDSEKIFTPSESEI